MNCRNRISLLEESICISKKSPYFPISVKCYNIVLFSYKNIITRIVSLLFVLFAVSIYSLKKLNTMQAQLWRAQSTAETWTQGKEWRCLRSLITQRLSVLMQSKRNGGVVDETSHVTEQLKRAESRVLSRKSFSFTVSVHEPSLQFDWRANAIGLGATNILNLVLILVLRLLSHLYQLHSLIQVKHWFKRR